MQIPPDIGSCAIQIARTAVETYVLEGRVYQPSLNELPEELHEQSGVFVTIKKNHELRGCVGTIAPTQPTIAEEIAQNAVSSAVKDTRFYPVSEEELPYLTYSVYLLMPPEPIQNKNQLDVNRYGVIVEKDRRRGLLLPGIEGIDTIDDQIAIAKQKAGIMPAETPNLYRFEVIKFDE